MVLSTHTPRPSPDTSRHPGGRRAGVRIAALGWTVGITVQAGRRVARQIAAQRTAENIAAHGAALAASTADLFPSREDPPA